MANEYIAEAKVAVRADTTQVKGDIEKGIKDAVGSSSTKQAASGLSGLTDVVKGLGGASGQAGSAVDVLDSALSGTAGTVALVGGAIAAAVGVAALSVDAYEKLGSSVQRFGAETGTSAETASRFVAVLGDYGISADTAANSLSYLARTAETNEKRLTDLGVTVKRTSNGQLDLVGTTASLADAYASTSDPGRRAALVMAALGEQGRALLPILDKGGEGISKLLAGVSGGQILKDSDVQNAEAFKVAINDLHGSFQGIEIALGRGIVPALAAGVRAVTPAVEAASGIASALQLTAASVTEAFRNPTELRNLDALELKVKGTTDAVDGLAQAQKDLADAAQAADAELKAELSILDVTLRDEAARRQLGDATKELWVAQADYNDALAGTGKYAQAAIDAARDLTSAQNGLADAQRRVRDLTVDIGNAQGDVAEAEFRFGSQSKEAADAREALTRKEEDLAAARAGAAESTQKVADAEKKVADAKDLSDEQATAADRLRDARFKLEQQTAAVADADVTLQVTQAGLRGEVVDSTTKVGLLRQALEHLMGPLPQDAKNDLEAILRDLPQGLLDTSIGSAGVSGQAGITSLVTGVATGSGPTAPAPSGAGGVASIIGRNAAQSSTPPVNVTINYPVDWQQMIEQAEYASGVR